MYGVVQSKSNQARRSSSSDRSGVYRATTLHHAAYIRSNYAVQYSRAVCRVAAHCMRYAEFGDQSVSQILSETHAKVIWENAQY